MLTAKPTLRMIIALCALGALSGCLQTLPGKTSKVQSKVLLSPEQLLVRAQSAEPVEATRLRLEAADQFSLRGNQAAAEKSLQLIDAQLLTPTQQGLANLITAEIALSKSDHNKAAQVLQQAKTIITDHQQLQRVMFADALLLEQQNKLDAALSARMQLSQQVTTPYLLNQNREAIWRLVNQLPLANYQTQTPQLAAWISLAKIVRQPTALKAQQQAVRDWQRANPQHEAALYPPVVVERLLAISLSDMQHIGLVLPSSGRFSVPAQAIRFGFLAAQAADQAAYPEQMATEVSFYDSLAINNLDAFYQSAQAAGVDLLVGPWERELITQMAYQPNLKIPTLALNYLLTPSVTPTPNLYQFGIAPEDEARQVAIQAWNEGLSKATVITLKNHDTSQRASQAFTQAFVEAGGSVVQTLELMPSNRMGEEISQALTADRQAEFVFLQTTPPLAKTLQPYIQRDNSQLPIYAISTAISDFSPNSSPLVSGVRLTEMPWFTDDSPLKAQIIQQRPDAAGGMGRFYAMGADAYQLAKRFRQLSDIDHTQINGLTGTLILNQQQQIERYTDWVELNQGRLVSLPNYAAPE